MQKQLSGATGRRTGALERLVIPALCDVLFRGFFVILLIGTMGLTRPYGCTSEIDIAVYSVLGAAILLHSCTFIYAVVVMRLSGAIRSDMIPDILVNVLRAGYVLQAFEVVLVMFATVGLPFIRDGCVFSNGFLLAVVIAVLVLNWLLVFINLGCSLVSTDLLTGSTWGITCKRVLCFGCWGRRENIDSEEGERMFEAIGESLTSIFQNFKVIPSEVATALILLRHFQKCQSISGKRFLIPMNDRPNDCSLSCLPEEEKDAPELLDAKENEENSVVERDKDSEGAGGENQETSFENHRRLYSADSLPSPSHEIESDVRHQVFSRDSGPKSRASMKAYVRAEQVLDDAQKASRGIQPELSETAWRRLADARYFSKFALGAYGLPLYTLDHPFGLCTNCCCVPSGLDTSRIQGTNMCGHSSMRIFLRLTGVDPSDILHASFCTGFDRLNYFVAQDSKRKCFVIAIRGTESFAETAIDVDAATVKIDPKRVKGFGNDNYTHKGIYQACCRAHDEIQSNALVQACFDQHKDWPIVCTGHSLGGAACTLLTLMFRSDYVDAQPCERDRVRGFPMAPPQILNLSLAQHPEVRRIITSVVNDEDMIPRLSLLSTVRLTHQLACLMRACPLSHWSIYRESKAMGDDIQRMRLEAHLEAERHISEQRLAGKRGSEQRLAGKRGSEQRLAGKRGSGAALLRRKAANEGEGVGRSERDSAAVATATSSATSTRPSLRRGISRTLDGDFVSAVNMNNFANGNGTNTNNNGTNSPKNGTNASDDRVRLLEDETRSDLPFYGTLRQRPTSKKGSRTSESLQFLNLEQSYVSDHVRPRGATRVRAQHFFHFFSDLKAMRRGERSRDGANREGDDEDEEEDPSDPALLEDGRGRGHLDLPPLNFLQAQKLSDADLGRELRKRVSALEVEIDRSIERDNHHSSELRLHWRSLHVPGVIFHMVKSKHIHQTKSVWRCNKPQSKKDVMYCVYEAHPDSFREVMASTRMFLDHFPNTYDAVINELPIPEGFADAAQRQPFVIERR